MFFLTTYGVLNIAAGLERFLGNPSYRPKFKVHWILSLAGAVGCVGVMVLIDPVATAVAAGFVLIIYFWLEHREMKSAWGDVKLGIWLNLTRAGLLRIRQSPDPKNWRPHILVLSGAPTRRWHLIRLASALSHNRALLTVSSILPAESVSTDRIRALSSTIYEYLDRHNIQALVRLIAADNPFTGAKQLVETYGLGMLVPNTIMLGDSQVLHHRKGYCDMIRYFHSAQRNTMIVRLNEKRGFGLRKRIDVWWGGQRGNGGLMLILSYLMQTSVRWRGSRVRVKMVVPTRDAADGAQSNISSLLDATRIDADTEILVSDGRSFPEILKESSVSTDLVFLGMAAPGDNFEEYYEMLQERTADLPSTVFVLAAEDIEFDKVIL
jgi:solute carrier family 12 (sodium/potassium/chloride transporter), member 2